MHSADTPQVIIYAINLDRSLERWEELSREAAALGLPVQRVAAIDGTVVEAEERVDANEPAFMRNNGRHMIPGEYGCYRSHMKALSTFLEAGLPQAIIVEDDIRLSSDLPQRAAAALAAVPGADVIKLFNHRMVGFRIYATSDRGDRIGRAIHGPMGSAACYAVTRAGAAKLVEQMKVMEYPFDIALERGWAIGAEVLTVDEDVVTSKRSASTIANRSGYKERKFVWWKRLPTHWQRARDYLQRIRYALKGV
ncbi:glycosyl transferase family 25 [Pseudorhizobium halotolerans]|uniref:Glycosyl transferase family 25 n=1 Tax=Pseudorhizobium halotolerans TaxID=1233081 RepID=A0ABM8PQ45_9HYPH|nr:glycosyltransferase family 25 protein [Pseudorhizobium halotolerans]CAD7041877.1 glycosyl transferase family 25 [Pseudorhizobium halotolerans]